MTLSDQSGYLLQTDGLRHLSGSENFCCHVVVRAIGLLHDLRRQQYCCFMDAHCIVLLALAAEGSFIKHVIWHKQCIPFLHHSFDFVRETFDADHFAAVQILLCFLPQYGIKAALELLQLVH